MSEDSSNFSKNSAFEGGVRSLSSPHSLAVGKMERPKSMVDPFQIAIYLRCKEWRKFLTTIYINNRILENFAEGYVKENPPIGKGKLQFVQTEVDAALAAFQREFQYNHPKSLLNQFRSLKEHAAPPEDIESFADWYIFQSGHVTPDSAANPDEETKSAMIENFQEGLERMYPEFSLYNSLFSKWVDFVSLDFMKETKIDTLSLIRSSFNGTLPENGTHSVPYSFIFKNSEGSSITKILDFFRPIELAVSLALLYHQDGRLIVDKKYQSRLKDLTGKTCVVFLDNIGEYTVRNRGLNIVKTGSGCIGGRFSGVYSQNDADVDDGLSQEIDSAYGAAVKDFANLRVDYTNKHRLREEGIPGWHTFMLSIGAFPFKMSFGAQD